ncbi:MAG: hypothetical protein LC114_03825 [Bryobacterales bacterium]|nr:hypothetical protein [Bryobacterales bacterium]
MRVAFILLISLLLTLASAWFATESRAAGEQIDQNTAAGSSSKLDEEGPRLPNGKLQRDAILKHDLKRDLKDLREIRQLSDELIDELQADTAFVLSIKSLKKLERIEKLAGDVRKRVRK